MKIVRPVFDTVEGVGHGVRDLARLQSVAGILIKHGLGAAVAGLEIPGLVAPGNPDDTTPQRTVAAIQELGPTFVKLGQVLSARSDVLPEEYCAEFRQLQDQVTPVPFDEIIGVLNQGLGEDWRDRIDLEETPLATASIAQVHRGTLGPEGTDVVLKVQRPGIKRIIEADLNILQAIARQLAEEYPEVRALDSEGMLGEFAASMRAELDFLQEAHNTRRFRKLFGDTSEVRVPKVFPELTTDTVLCLEFLDGVRMRDARNHGVDMSEVGRRYLACIYDQLFVHGLFHGDLHPGNVLVLPGDVIGLLDFGMVGRLTPDMRDQVVAIMFALHRGDYRSIARSFYDIAIREDRVDYRTLEREALEVMERHWTGESMRDLQFGAFVTDLVRRAGMLGCRIPSQYTMFFKAVMTAEGLTKELIPEVDPIAAIEPYFQRIMAERVSWSGVEAELMRTGMSLQALVTRLPITLGQVLDDIEGQRLRLNIQTNLSREAMRHADRLVNRAILAAVTIGTAACGIAAWSAQVGTTPGGIPLLGIVLLSIAGLCGTQLWFWVVRSN